MKILNFGSLNIDHVYQVDHFVRAGETLASSGYARHMGGKGFNQSIALARAGAAVYHAGCMGEDGDFMRAYLREAGVNVAFLRTVDEPTGHAMIQVEPSGENCILLFGGANQRIEAAQIRETLAHFAAGDILLLQNEVSGLPALLEEGAKRGLRIAINPAPMDAGIVAADLSEVRWLIVNEGEGAALSGAKNAQDVLAALREKYPHAAVVLTLGEKGAYYQDENETCFVKAFCAGEAVDTTGAGDTFTGYFLAGIAAGASAKRAMEIAARASGIAVTRAGAAQSIPPMAEVNPTGF